MDQPTHVHLEDSEYAPRKSKDSHRQSSCQEKWDEEEQDYQEAEENYRNEQQQPQEFEQDDENYYNNCGEQEVQGNGQWDDSRRQSALAENEKIQNTKRKILYANETKNPVDRIDIFDLKRQFSLGGSDQTPLQPQHRVHIHNSTKNSPKKSKLQPLEQENRESNINNNQTNNKLDQNQYQNASRTSGVTYLLQG